MHITLKSGVLMLITKNRNPLVFKYTANTTMANALQKKYLTFSSNTIFEKFFYVFVFVFQFIDHSESQQTQWACSKSLIHIEAIQF